MKKWERAIVEEIDIRETAEPGKGNHYGNPNGTNGGGNNGNHYGWGDQAVPPVVDPQAFDSQDGVTEPLS